MKDEIRIKGKLQCPTDDGVIVLSGASLDVTITAPRSAVEKALAEQKPKWPRKIGDGAGFVEVMEIDKGDYYDFSVGGRSRGRLTGGEVAALRDALNEILEDE